MKLKYKYLIYKVYSWTANKKGDTPIANTILALAIMHFFQLLTILFFIDQVITPLDWVYNIKKGYLFIGAIIYFIIFYFLVYNKSRWNNYVEEYKTESTKEKREGNVLVILFLIGSIIIFFISLPVFFAIGKHLHK
jgi:amino acid transporter